MSTTTSALDVVHTAMDRPWPRVKWNHDDLKRVADSLQIINPSGFSTSENLQSYIMGTSERELYRHNGPIDTGTGGWHVCFMPAYTHLQADYDYVAIVSVTPYCLDHYLKNK